MKQNSVNLFSFPLLFVTFAHFTETLALSPAPAPSQAANTPAPAMVPLQPSKGPLDIVKVLQKVGYFNFFIRLVKSTQEDLQLFSQLNNSSDGVTVFAPTDGAFSSIIKSGTLNSLTDQEKIKLVQFHVIPKYLSTSQFQYVSNPLETLAGSGGNFALNVTTSDDSVNVTSGLTRTYVSGVVYSDGKVGVYQVDKVLLPLELFSPKPPAQAPAPPPENPKKDESEGEIDGEESPVVADDINSSAVILSFINNLIMLGVVSLVAEMFFM